MTKPQRILVLAPHGDDEVLGCGGVIAKYANLGAQIAVCIITEPYESEWTAEYVRRRPKEIAKAHRALGVKKTFMLGLPTVKLDTIGQKEINDKLADVVRRFRPEVIYIPHAGDLNRDHRIVHEAALVCARPVKGNAIRAVYAYETLSETEWGTVPFIPSVYEDVRRNMNAKLSAMRAYGSEIKPFPHPRSLEAIEALAKKRGAESGYERAEAFMLLRQKR